MSAGPVRRDAATSTFFDAAARGEFLIRRCGDSHASEPSAEVCSTCGSVELTEEAASGRASLVSWTVVHTRATGDEPARRVVAVIGQLEEGPWWWTQLVDAEPEDLAVGAPLRIRFDRHPESDEAVPVFAPAP